MQQQQQQEEEEIHQGVLYKRRDVFKNRWRPRYFMLDVNRGVLTYYLPEDGISHVVQEQSSYQTTRPSTASLPSDRNHGHPRFHVVPRGTIYIRDCQVDIDPKHTKESEQFYAFIILPPCNNNSNDPPCFLAAKSQQERSRWIQKISRAADGTTTTSATATTALSVSLNHEEEEQSQQQQGRTENSEQNDSLQPQPSQPKDVSNNDWKDYYDNGDSSSQQQKLLENVPQPLASRIQQMIQTTLPYMSPHNVKEHGWSLLFDENSTTGGGIKAYSRQHYPSHEHNNGTSTATTATTTMMKTTAVLPYSPLQILNVLVHPTNRSKLETNIRLTERIKVYNPHTFVDYYAYRPVWPTTARDFVAVGHWRVLQKQTNNTTKQTVSVDEKNKDTSTTSSRQGHENHRNNTTTTTTTSTANETKEQQQQLQKAICIIGFSYSNNELQQLKPSPMPNHVRGNLFVTMYLLEEVGVSATSIVSSSRPSCRLTRVLSFDLCGNVPSALTKTIVEQQAHIPTIIEKFLQQHHTYHQQQQQIALSNSSIIQEIINKFPTSTTTAATNGNNTNDVPSGSNKSNAVGQRQTEYSERSGLSVIMDPETTPRGSSLFLHDDDGSESGDDIVGIIKSRLSKLLLKIIWLLQPLMIWRVMDKFGIPGKEIVFVVIAFVAVRTIVTEYHLGRPYHDVGRGSNLIGYTTCRFVVDLKGVLRFMANKKEEFHENASSTSTTTNNASVNNNQESQDAEISVVHIVIKAMAQAMSEFEVLSAQKVSIPLLGIDGYYFPHKRKSKGIDVSLFTSSSSGRDKSKGKNKDDLVTLSNATSKSIQDIANILTEATDTSCQDETRLPPNASHGLYGELWQSFSSLWSSNQATSLSSLGQCVVFVTPDSDHCEVDMDIIPPPLPQGDGGDDKVTVTVVVGGVRLIKDKRRSASARSPPKPVISMALTIDCPACNITTSRRFAERVQKLVQFPEMCED